MFRSVSIRHILICLISLLSGNAIAQPMLPDMIGASDKGINVLSWNCQYDGLKFIAVQRSADSVFNYVTIGYVKDISKGVQAYIDGHPAPGDNWYRLNIGFSSDLTWNSNRIKISIDSATLLAKSVVPPNDSLQKFASSIVIESNEIVASSINKSLSSPPKPSPGGNRPAPTPNRPATTQPAKPNLSLGSPAGGEPAQYSYIKSQYVFTNPFTGHVTVELPESTRYAYSIKFYRQNDDKNVALDIPRIKHKSVVIDKRNFSKKGIYKFILMEGPNKKDEGYITIY